MGNNLAYAALLLSEAIKMCTTAFVNHGLHEDWFLYHSVVLPWTQEEVSVLGHQLKNLDG